MVQYSHFSLSTSKRRPSIVRYGILLIPTFSKQLKIID